MKKLLNLLLLFAHVEIKCASEEKEDTESSITDTRSTDDYDTNKGGVKRKRLSNETEKKPSNAINVNLDLHTKVN